MAKKLYEESNIQDIASAIRAKNGTQNQYTVAQMPSAIRAIETQPDLEQLNVSANGDYSPSSGKDGFSAVHVAVPATVPVLQEKTTTENGIVTPDSGYDGLSKVTVNVSSSSPELSKLATRVWTKRADIDERNATISVQTGIIDNGTFVPTGEAVDVVNGRFDGEYTNRYTDSLIGIYKERVGFYQYWTVFNVAPCDYNNTNYAYIGNKIQRWDINTNVDFLFVEGTSEYIPFILSDYFDILVDEGASLGPLVKITNVTPYELGKYIDPNGIDISYVYGGGSIKNSQQVQVTGPTKFYVLIINSEGNTKDLSYSIEVDGVLLSGQSIINNPYSGSGDNRRNYNLIEFDIGAGAHDVTLPDKNLDYTYRFYFITNSIYETGYTFQQAISKPDAYSNGSYSKGSIVIYGVSQSAASGTLTMKYSIASEEVQTASPGSSYASSFIFWFSEPSE